MPRKHFSEELTSLHQEILKMGILVEETIRKAIRSLKNQETGLASQVLEDDITVNSFEQNIQDRCIILLATEQPVAGDLRTIITTLKAAAQLERIGDHAVHIAEGVLKIASEPLVIPLVEVSRMAEIAISMIHDILTALVDNNEDFARDIARRDDELDELYHRMTRELISRMVEDPRLISQGVELIFITRYLERMGDHVTNICELVVYSSSGDHVELNR